MSGFPQQSGEFQAGSKPEVNREAKESGKVDSQIGRRFERLFIYSSGPDCGRMETIVRSDLKGSSWPGVIQGQMVAPSSIIYAYSALGVQAVLPIVLGAFASVKTPRSIRKAVKAAYLERVAKIAYGNVNDRIPHPDEIYNALAGEEGPDDDEDEDEDRVGLQDSLWFPLMASCALFGFFILFKFVDPIWINRFISIYCELRLSKKDKQT
ncbi:hypothetical protein QFC19_004982 [Naganishia cerealis]|uniref:Uncharacterized protein n=1 Tax=Naganishia cerealis TaxID=610337 RepID=A0ACC2VRJ5_9TREE|nr:hypothetical protein QFC19_004982 [Naganishia cerealis]